MPTAKIKPAMEGPARFAFVLLTMGILIASSPAETASQLLEQGLAAAEAGRFDEAAAKFTELIARSPRVPELSLFYISR